MPKGVAGAAEDTEHGSRPRVGEGQLDWLNTHHPDYTWKLLALSYAKNRATIEVLKKGDPPVRTTTASVRTADYLDHTKDFAKAVLYRYNNRRGA